MQTIYIYILLAMVFSAFFSGMEIAFASSSKMRFALEKDSQRLPDKILAFFYRHPHDFVSSLLIGYNIALVVYCMLVARLVETHLLTGILEYTGVVILVDVLLATLVILLFCEFLPRAIFKVNPNRALRVFAIPLFLVCLVLYPLSKCILFVVGLLLRLLGKRVSHQVTSKALTKVDLDYFIQSSLKHSDDEDVIDTEVKIFQNALDFSNVKIRDCIVPRTEIQAVDIDTGLDELRLRFIESGHSKLIVYKENIDNIVGYVHSSEMFRHPKEWNKHIQEVPIVPENMSAQKLMKLFMQQKKTLAVVVDEFGGTSGIVSLEDLVEEIFGEIEDEHDTTNYVAKRLNETEYILSARLEIERANELFDLHLPESEDYLTISGLILHEYQGFPKLNETVCIGRFHFKIIRRTTTKIELVRLKVVE